MRVIFTLLLVSFVLAGCAANTPCHDENGRISPCRSEDRPRTLPIERPDRRPGM